MFNNKNYSTKLLGLQGVIIENIEEKNGTIEVAVSLERKTHCCPRCGADTNRIHDYRKQIITDLNIHNKKVKIHLRKRRYVCSHCQKRFIENTEFLSKYARRTMRVTESIINSLRDSVSYSKVAKDHNVSVTTAIRIFDAVSYNSKPLPPVLLIDEFRGNTDGEKFQCILMDGETKEIIDILPSRKYADLCRYFSKKDTSNVRFLVSDLWKPYRDLCRVCFRKAKHVADKYHVIRQTGWAMEDVRKNEQKALNKDSRLRYKRCAYLLRKSRLKLKDDEAIKVSQILSASPKLKTAYWLKESFYDVYNSNTRASAYESLKNWCLEGGNCNIARFIKCSKTMSEWSQSILNSIEFPYTNGPIEGMNNKIKVLKRISYGVRNFKRFRNRIIHLD